MPPDNPLHHLGITPSESYVGAEGEPYEEQCCLVVAMSAVLAASTAWATENTASRHHGHGRHVTHATPAPTSDPRAPAVESGSLDRFHSPFKPYVRPGDGNNDGLSRDADECHKGCIDGNSG